MKNITAFLLILVIVAVVGTFVVKGTNILPSDNPNPPTGGSGEVQQITLSYKDYNYFPNTITVKVNQPVSITLDSSIRGCYRSFTIRDLGVSKYSKTPSETIDFTPTKTGTFRFACSMGMGTGTIIVE